MKSIPRIDISYHSLHRKTKVILSIWCLRISLPGHRVRKKCQYVDAKVLEGVVYISLSDNMLYTSGSYEISNKAGTTLSKIAKVITDYKDY